MEKLFITRKLEFLEQEYQNYVRTYKLKNYDKHYKNFEWWHEDTEKEYADLVECPQCYGVVHEDELVNHKWDLNNTEPKICEGCQNDEL
jgi:vacuolar-type H+-ATPase catalytic subunit A/Vma1